jgi:hypothetical protein
MLWKCDETEISFSPPPPHPPDISSSVSVLFFDVFIIRRFMVRSGPLLVMTVPQIIEKMTRRDQHEFTDSQVVMEYQNFVMYQAHFTPLPCPFFP